MRIYFHSQFENIVHIVEKSWQWVIKAAGGIASTVRIQSQMSAGYMLAFSPGMVDTT